MTATFWSRKAEIDPGLRLLSGHKIVVLRVVLEVMFSFKN